MKGFIFLGLGVSPILYAQTKVQDTTKTYEIEAVSFARKLPVTKDIINVEKKLSSINLGQDLPYLLNNQTSVVATSDAGNGIGYTGFRIRGVGGNSINVMLNGVPYNDSESMGTFFVNIPDFTSSASQIVIQRGVGSSTNGVSSFGATVNVISKDPSDEFSIQTDDTYGSFNTYKYSAEINTGKFWKNRLSVIGRYSKIHSDGYIDRAFSDLDSYNFAAKFEEGKTKIRFITFGGKEKTYQAWNGIDKATWESDPKFNPAGAIYNTDGSIRFYNNETDNYKQNHYQLLWEQNLNSNWNLETTLHYTKGRGYYENYKQDAKFSKYNLPNIFENGVEIKRTDFIREKWLNNDFYGLVSTLYGKLDRWDLNFGLVANQYYGRHYGNVTGVQYTDIQKHEYYRNNSLKNEISGYAKAIYRLDQFEFYGDLQLRNIQYSTNIVQQGDGEGVNLEKNWSFFNPKAGVNYKFGAGKVYFSYANAKREPNRDDLFTNPEIKPEQLHDFELGVETGNNRLQFSANAYYMNYTNQLVLTGAMNDVGSYIRTNSGKSYRLGLELNGQYKISEMFSVLGNTTLSDNKNLDFKLETDTGTQELGKTPISFSPNFIANLRLEVKPIRNLILGIQNKWVGSQFLDNTNTQDLKLAAFSLADFNTQYVINFAKTDVAFKFLLNNIFNKKYVSNGSVYDAEPYYFSQAGINFMMGINITLK